MHGAAGVKKRGPVPRYACRAAMRACGRAAPRTDVAVGEHRAASVMRRASCGAVIRRTSAPSAVVLVSYTYRPRSYTLSCSGVK